MRCIGYLTSILLFLSFYSCGQKVTFSITTKDDPSSNDSSNETPSESSASISSLENTYGLGRGANDIVFFNDYAYVAKGRRGLEIFDVADPANPTLVGLYNTAGDTYSVAIIGTYAYLADGANDLVIVDISTPASPTLVGNYNIGGLASGVAITPMSRISTTV